MALSNQKRLEAYLITSILFFNIASAFAQTQPPSDLKDADLRTWLKNNWYDGKHSSLGYNNARKELFGKVDEEGGKVYCAYSGFWMNAEFVTYPDPINTEHVVPQSFFGSASPMKSDLHHLFPTHQDVNSARGGLPFGEVNDHLTDQWFTAQNNTLVKQSNTPSANIDDYSELDQNNMFEPKEDAKGNVARAVFYFYTMYPTQAGAFAKIGDMNTLYQWHLDDPVDAHEINRNTRINEEQGNLNPYISFPTLLGRAWGYEVEEPSCKEPHLAASNATVSEITPESASISWSNGNGEKRMVIVSEASISSSDLPLDGSEYSFDPFYGEQGDRIGNAYVVYYSSGSRANISSLAANTTYHYAVIEAACEPIDYLTSTYASGTFSTSVTGIQSHWPEELLLQRPTSKTVQLVSTQAEKLPIQYSVVAITGSTLLKGEQHLPLTIDLGGMESGIYLLHIHFDGNSAIRKINIQ